MFLYKRTLIFICIFILIINSFAFAKNPADNKAISGSIKQYDNYPPDIKKILDRGKLIVGIYCMDKPPFIMTNAKGELYGLDISLAKDIAKHFGVSVEFDRSAKSYEELLTLVINEKVDVVISKFSRTFERAKRVQFSTPYIVFRQALILNKKFIAKNKIEDYPIDYLKKEKVIIGASVKTSYVEFARDIFKKAEIVEDKWENLVPKVLVGDINGLFRDEYEVMKVIKQNPDYAVYVSVYILKDKKDYISMAVPINNNNLLAWVNMYLEVNYTIKTAKDIIEEYPEAWK